MGNDIRASSVLNFENRVNFHDFSVKYVLSGNEIYQLHKKSHKVASGEYIIGNETTTATVIINSNEPVKGICIDISKEKINEIIDLSFSNSHNFKKFLFNQKLINNKYNTSNTYLGNALSRIGNQFDEIQSGKVILNDEIFYSIAECIVKDQKNNFKQFQSLNTVKEETNARLFSFIHDAKNFIDSNYLEKIQLEEIAKESKLSQYHFIRLFKRVFKITPYQYILHKRLQFALILLREGNSIIDVTYQTGFSNPSNFCKAFKNQFGKSPKKFYSKN